MNITQTQPILKDSLTSLPRTPKMPALFLGHGSPMNAISENEFTETFRRVGQELPRPQAILCVSAHWETEGTWLTAMDYPRTIHDFYGFPDALYKMQYLACGSPNLATGIVHLLQKYGFKAQIDMHRWGFDHGTWSILAHMYPHADIPVIQLSLDINKTPEEHYELAKRLNILRHKGVLIIGSGNIVHNLGEMSRGEQNYGFSWALETKAKVNQLILEGNHDALIDYKRQGEAFNLSIPTPEHYLPLLYILALQDTRDEIQLLNDKAVMGSITMTSILLS